MEAKESSAAPGAAALPETKDGPVSNEGHPLDAESLAKEAAFLFQSCRLQDCLHVLNQLLQKKQDDPKEQSEELACSSRGQIESGNNSENNMSRSKVNSASLHQLSAINSGRIVNAEEFDTSVTLLNVAVVPYHVHEYAHALFLLETLYQNIEPIDERIALHVCLLLLDVALACRDASKAADVIRHLEIFFGVGHALGQGDSGRNIQPQSNIPASNACCTDFSGSLNAQESALTRTLSDETLEYETSYSTLDTGTYNLERPTANANSKLAADHVASAIDLKLNLHLYKVQLLLLTRNLKSAMREIKLAMNITRFGDSSVSLLLKSQLEYARGNHRKAIKLLMTYSNRCDPGMLC